MKPVRVMGLDVGDATIGVAISDALQITAQGRETRRRTSTKEDIDYLVDLVAENDVSCIVIGMPYHMNGSLGVQGEKTQSFAKKLKKKITYSDRLSQDVEIVYWDERLTTVGATRALIEGDVRREKRKKIVDTLAAVLILQGYLDKLKASAGERQLAEDEVSE